MKKLTDTRRDFIKKTALSTAALSVGGILPGFSAASYRNIVGANERIRVAMMGVNARGLALAQNFSQQFDCESTYRCEVDTRPTEKCRGAVEKSQQRRPAAEPDIRKLVTYADVDALVVAAPGHWHAPAALLASQAGK